MRAGAYQVGIHGILGTTRALLQEYGPRPVVMTGGLGEYLASAEWPHEPDWTLLGAAWLAEFQSESS
jgi:hypothetical protein